MAVVAAIATPIIISNVRSSEEEQKAAAAARRIGCGPIEEEPDLPNEHVEPFAQGEDGVPAVGGNHSSALPPEPKVYTQQPPEENAVHNLEHGYVLVYYAADGENALDEKFVTALEDLVNDETEVLMSPYEGLAKPLYLTAWGVRRGCDPPAGASTDDVVTGATGFIDEWKNGQFAPEAAAQ
ncbi:MAG: DUF3105 domain-containing protein [Actinomycetota bacterium]